MDQISKILTILILLFLTVSGSAVSQNWDYEKHPHLPLSINHLDAELEIDATGLIEGDLLYSITFRDAGVDSIILHAPGIEMINVVVNDESKNFYKENEKLVIYLDKQAGRGDVITLRIQYRSTPQFGLYITENGSFWTSLLPGSTSHWMPVFDHPRVEFTSELVITHPSGKMVVANGRIGDTEIVSVDKELTTFIANKPVSPVGISLVMGVLDRIASTTQGEVRERMNQSVAALFQRRSDNQIHLYSETNSIDGAELIAIAADTYARAESFLDYPYPFRDLNIVVLEDDFWEVKPYGSGVLYLYKSKGDLERQVRMGVLSQWLGAYVREEQWDDPDAVNLLKAYVANELFTLDYRTGDVPAPYHKVSDQRVSQWQYFLKQNENEAFRRNLVPAIGIILSENHKILDWNKLATVIYNNSGLRFFDRFPSVELPSDEETGYEYLARMEWNEDDRTVQINFESLGEPIDELVTVQVSEATFQGDRQHELTFTGRSDAILLNVSAGVENLTLNVVNRDDLVLDEKKPFQFWIYQLQNDDDPQSRREAAKALSDFPDNPDLQLALTDMINGETDSNVYAEIIRSLSAITMGASGTDQIFLNHSSDRHPTVVRVAAIEGLAYFYNNDQVISRLRSIINQTDNSEMRRASIRSLYEVTEPQAFRNITESLITHESVLYEVPMMLKLLAEHGEEEAAVQFSSTFLTEGFPYSIREEVLRLVIEYDNSRTGWENRLPDLLSDQDPRIRYKSVQGLEKVSESTRNAMIKNRLSEEFDERVRMALRGVE
jgi:hypothetical protein